MTDVFLDVRDIDSSDRRALEHVIGQRLREDQQLVIRVVDAAVNRAGEERSRHRKSPDQSLPDWCNVYEGLSEEDIADLERSIFKRVDLTRSTE